MTKCIKDTRQRQLTAWCTRVAYRTRVANIMTVSNIVYKEKCGKKWHTLAECPLCLIYHHEKQNKCKMTTPPTGASSKQSCLFCDLYWPVAVNLQVFRAKWINHGAHIRTCSKTIDSSLSAVIFYFLLQCHCLFIV